MYQIKMNRNIKNILREKLIQINIQNNEISNKILKSIKQNNNIQIAIKMYSIFVKTKQIQKNFLESKKHKICIYTGKRSGLFKKFSFSRYIIKNMIIKGKFTNLKKKNW